MFAVTVKVKISVKQVRDIIDNWMENSMCSWVRFKNIHYAKDTSIKDYNVGGVFNLPDEHGWGNTRGAVAITVPGAYLLLTCDETDDGSETKDYKFGIEEVKTGLQIMADKYTKHFTDLLNETDDIVTADVFVQCCLFGEVVFG